MNHYPGLRLRVRLAIASCRLVKHFQLQRFRVRQGVLLHALVNSQSVNIQSQCGIASRECTVCRVVCSVEKPIKAGKGHVEQMSSPRKN